MTEPTSFDRGQQLLRMHTKRLDSSASFSLFGREWDLLDGVFSPAYCYSTQVFTMWLPYPIGGTLLEVGSGTGVLAVTAALRGCVQVTAVDISEVAVRNTLLNVRRHGVEHRVRVLHSDLFDALETGERFDVIFWNSNFIEPPAGFEHNSELSAAIFDPNYATHRRFLRSAPRRLNENGRLLLGFSNLGNRELLKKLSSDVGLHAETILSSKSALPTGIRYEMLEFLRWER
jgi:release factor glutamine methyltransferase